MIVVLHIFALALVLAMLLVRGIDKMKKEHPDYDGKDLFDEK